MAEIQGNSVVVKLSTDAGTTVKDLICEISHSLPLSRETSSITHKCNAGTTTRSLGAYSWEISGEAVADTAPSGTQISYEDLLSGFIAGTLYWVKVESGASGANYYHQGNAYLTSLELTNEVNGVSQFSFTFSGTGALDTTP